MGMDNLFICSGSPVICWDEGVLDKFYFDSVEVTVSIWIICGNIDSDALSLEADISFVKNEVL